VGAALLTVGAFAALTFPLVTDPLGSVVSHWDADIEHSLWLEWWFGRILETPGGDLFRTDMVTYPQVVDLHLADLNLAVNGVSAALARILGLAGAYNALLLGSFALSAFFAARLALRLDGEPLAAGLAGLAFAASAYWQSSVLNGWGYLVHIWVFPLAFLTLLRARSDPGPRRFAGLGLSLALAFHVTPYYFVYLGVLMGLFLVPDAPRLLRGLRSQGGLAALAAFALPLALLVLPRAIPMVWAAAEPLSVHHGPQNTELAASLVELVVPSARVVAERADRVGFLVVFVGYVTTATIFVGWSVSRRRRLYARWGIPGLLMLLLALGPELKLVDGAPIGVPLPARWLQELPVFALRPGAPPARTRLAPARCGPGPRPRDRTPASAAPGEAPLAGAPEPHRLEARRAPGDPGGRGPHPPSEAQSDGSRQAPGPGLAAAPARVRTGCERAIRRRLSRPRAPVPGTPWRRRRDPRRRASPADRPFCSRPPGGAPARGSPTLTQRPGLQS
jgi:hypothetical protein